MNNQAFSLAERLIPSTYVQQGLNAKKARENLIRHFIEHQKWPEEGWDDATIEAFLSDLSQMDSNNFPSNCSVGEREARIISNIVARRHFRMGHGIGRSSDLEEVQPKAAGSSLMYKLTNALVLEVIRYMGVKSIAGCFLSPMATGMSLVLCMLTFKQDRPRAKYVLWPRIDQKSSFKSIITAGLEPIVIETKIIGDELKTDMQRLESQMAALGESVACVLTTTSCFAPRACDSVDSIAALCTQYNIPHLINNAYGLQSTRCMHLIQEASRKGRVDAFVQSTDKNFLVPVGGAIIGSFDKNLLDRISKMYPGRASASSIMDVMITLLSLGMAGYKQLITQRKEMYSYLKEELGKLAARHDERLLDTKGNPISIGMTLQCLSHQHDNKQVTMLGLMLFLRNVSGTRVITTTESKHIVSHKFEGWGAHNSNYPVPYLTAAAALGMKKSDVDMFIQRLDKALTKVRRRSAPVTPTASLAGSSINGDAGGTGGPGESSTASTSRASMLCIAIATWFSYKGYLETRVNTPYDIKKLVTISGLDIPDRYWGTYRSGVYFGLRTRDPHSLITGLMWYFPHLLRQDGSGLRHWCEQNDKLDKYAWMEHDGKTFGIQEIVDNSAILTTTFIKTSGGKHGGDWTTRIAVTSKNQIRNGEEISLLFYTAMEENVKGWIKVNLSDEKLTSIEGNTQNLGSFSINLNMIQGTVEEHSFLVTVVSGSNVLKETVLQNLRIASHKGSSKKYIVLAGEQIPLSADGKKKDANFIATQVTGRIPFEIEISYESGSFINRVDKLTGQNYDRALEMHRQLFDEKFEKIFKLRSKGFTEEEIKFAKMALSNMMGSIGYFYGSSQVQSQYTKGPVPYWKAPLYTSVPSRSFFPRGFLWDEGFHGLLISIWDLEIELDIINHWFDLMNIEGWIPREMILGQEALAKVPEEFVTQINTNANPPTFFLTLHFILKHKQEEVLKKHFQFLYNLYPRLQAWFNWFNTTQTGDISSTYRWRGRDGTTNKELNPKTLTSGFDDYPRASHPNIDERHVDLRCWIAFAADIMYQISEILNHPSNKYQETYHYLSDNDLLNKLHLSPHTQTYADFGLHTDKVFLRKSSSPSRSHIQPSETIRIVMEDPTLRYVDSSFGYVSLFPFILQIINPKSPQLGKILQDLINPDLLWTKYGLRSLAKISPFYMKYNTEHDAPYWRGAIWMNLNYLTVRAAYYYSNIEGPYKNEAKKIYQNLRKNLIQNVIKQYKKSGYIWENYGDIHGEGKNSHPFTGWTSLVVLLMAEIY